MHKMKLLTGFIFLSVLLLGAQGSPIFQHDDEVREYDESNTSDDDYEDYYDDEYYDYDDESGDDSRDSSTRRSSSSRSSDTRDISREITASSMAASSTEEDSWWRFDDSSDEDESSDLIPDIRSSLRAAASRSLQGTRAQLGGIENFYRNTQRDTSINRHTRINMSQRRPRRHELWLPGNRDSDEWHRCHGMSTNDYEKTKRRIRQIMRFAQQDAEDDSRRIAPAGGRFPQETDNSIEIADGTIDGCIWLTYEQADAIYRSLREQHRTSRAGGRYKRKIIDLVKNPWSKWDISQPIVYKFDGLHNENQKTIIRDAFSHWEENTCIRFQEATMEQVIEQNHIVFTKSGRCQSYVGRVDINPQPISLDDACLYEFGVPVHEIGHALGFWHEQQRVDREDHIEIKWDNLGQYRSQYFTSDSVSHGVPYDLSSIMHYATYDGSVNAQKVIETKDPLFQQTPGQRVGLSFSDKKLINTAYCSETCEHIKLKHPCQHGGFQNANSCHTCVCPDGIGGRYCEKVAPAVNAVCGGEIDATSAPQYITSPGYATDYHYGSQQECSWLIKAGPNEKVSLEFVEDFGLYFHNAETCFHWVEVKHSGDFAKNGPRFCGNRDRPTVILNSTGSEMLVIFKSNYTMQLTNYMRGFKAKIVAVSEDGSNPAPTTTTTAVETTTTTATTTTTEAPWYWQCNFDSDRDNFYDWCSIQQEVAGDDFDWILKSGKTPSYNTGPTWAFDGRYYIYIETSRPRKYGDKAIIRLPDFERTGVHCVSFKYYMWGFHIKQLDVFKEDSSRDSTIIWTMSGQQKDMWLTGEVQVDLQSGDRIGFTGVRGKEFSGDIALDKIQIASGTC